MRVMKKTKFIMNRLLLLTLLSGPLATAVPVLATDFEKIDKTSEIKESTSQTSQATQSTTTSSEQALEQTTSSKSQQTQSTEVVVTATTESSTTDLDKKDKKDDKDSKKIPIQILGINDFHGALSTTGSAKLPQNFNKVGKSFYLSSELALAEANFKKEHPDGESIRVQAGDLVGASPANSALLRDEPTIKVMNRMNMEYGVLGNHEFDQGLKEFNRILTGGAAVGDQYNSITQSYLKEPSTMTILSANIFDKGTKNIPYGYKAYDVREFGEGEDKVKVGFIGIVTDEIPSLVLRKHVEDYDFEDPATAIARNAKLLREEEGVNSIVVIGHTGASQNGDSVSGETPAIIDKVNAIYPDNGIEAYFAGHSHSYANADYNGVRVIQATSQGKAFSEVTGELDTETKHFTETPKGEVKPVLNDESTPVTSLSPDNNVKQIVDEADELATTVTKEVIGTTDTKQTISRAVNNDNDQESAVGNLVTDGQLAAARKEKFDGGVQFAMTNNGGIREDLKVDKDGNITWGAAQAVQPFGNIMQVISIKGSDLVDALNQQFEKHYFLQIAGMNYTYTGERTEEKDDSGKVISSTDTRKIKDVYEITPDGKKVALDLDRTYNVVINDFLFGGGDGFTAFTKGKLLGALDPDTDIFVNHIKETKTISAKVEGRKKAATQEASHDFTVLHTNDMHGRMAPEFNADKTELNTIGLAKLKTFKDDTQPTLMLDAGDAIQGLPLSNFTKGEDMVKAMNAVGYDAMAVGNHEFDFSYERAYALKDELNFPIVAANIYKDGTRSFEPYTLINKNGMNFLVIGLTTPETYTKTHPNNIKDVEFKDPIPEAKKAIKEAQSEFKGTDFDQIIFVTHLGIDGSTPEKWRSTGVAKALDEEPDLKDENIMFVDGHSHTKMDHGREEGRVKIVQAGEHMKFVGQVDVKQAEKVSSYDANLIPANDFKDVAEDAEVKEIVDNAIKHFDATNKEVLLVGNPYLLNGVNANVRTRETNLGNLLADGVYHYAQTGFSRPADFSIINGGGIRESIKPGDITKGDVITVLPFGNIVSQVEIKGEDIYKMFEVSVRSDIVEEDGKPVLDENGLPTLGRNGGFLQISDSIRFFYDSTKQATVLNTEGTAADVEGERVSIVEIKNPKTGEFEPVDKAKNYYVATNDFLAAGGDGYYMLGGKREEGPSMDTVLADFLKEDVVVDALKAKDDKIPLSNYQEEFPNEGRGSRIISKEYEAPAVEFNLANLDKAIKDAETQKETDYTTSSWKPFVAALEEAKKVQKAAMEMPDSMTQEKIDEATEALVAAQTELIAKEQPGTTELNLDKLNKAIKDAETKKEADYTATSWKSFAEALSEAKVVQKAATDTPEKVTQKQIDSVTKELVTAQDKLIAIAGKGEPGTTVPNHSGGSNGGSGSSNNKPTGTNQNGKDLPKTGEEELDTVAIGLVLIGTGAMCGHYIYRKRKEDVA